MNLRRTLFSVVTAGVALLLLLMGTEASAQIWTEYTISIEERVYRPQAGTQIPRAQFVDLFNSIQNPDDGVTRTAIPLGFTVEYDGQLFDRIWVSVNGFASFEGRFITSDPFTLFEPTNGPNLTLAPYFGDHYLRDFSIDGLDDQGRPFTTSAISYRQIPATQDPLNRNRRGFVIEWENLNINYFFDPERPDDIFSANRSEQATSIASFQLWIFEAEAAAAPSLRPTIEFHYGDIGPDNGPSIVKTSGASVGIEDEPKVPNASTTFINAVTYAETGDPILARTDRRLSSNWPPTGLPGRIFVFSGEDELRGPGWGDGDANLTQLDRNVPQNVKQDQRLFVTMADVIRILRHRATRDVDFDSVYGRHAFHGDVNHNGRFYYSTRNWNNSGDSLDINGDVVRYKVLFPIKSTNHELPLPLDNSFSGFYFEADEFDAGLIMTYLAAKLPVLPWLPDTIPHFTGKAVVGRVADGVTLTNEGAVTGRIVEIPVRLNGMAFRQGIGISMQAAEGTRILEIRTPDRTAEQWVLSANGEDRVAIAAAGTFDDNDVIATLVVEANADGEVVFEDVSYNGESTGARRLGLSAGTTGGAVSEFSLSANWPNPFRATTTTALEYTVPTTGKVTLSIFDQLGREVVTLVNGEMPAGTYVAEWNGTDVDGAAVAAGVYYCKLQAGERSDVTVMQVTK